MTSDDQTKGSESDDFVCIQCGGALDDDCIQLRKTSKYFFERHFCMLCIISHRNLHVYMPPELDDSDQSESDDDHSPSGRGALIQDKFLGGKNK